MRNYKRIIVGFLAAVVILGGLTVWLGSGRQSQSNNLRNSLLADIKQVILYKSSTCGCCVNYASYLEKQGIDVKVVKEKDMSEIKDRYGIPREMESCHTAVYGNYVVEGHVPIEAINRLLSERPDIDGISLPNMPSGSPGMPGLKKESFIIYAIKGGQSSVFTEL